MSNLITTEGVYGVRESGLIVPKEHAEIKVASPTSGIVLDPVCGSGTVADSAANVCRRFIVIDRNHDAVETTKNRLPVYVRKRTFMVEWFEDQQVFYDDPMAWDCGYNFIVRGDCIDVLRSMPDSFIALVYADPPFNANRKFINKKTGQGFSDIWKFDEEAEKRLEEIKTIGVSDTSYFADKTESVREKKRDGLVKFIEYMLSQDWKDRASYLTWCILLLLECRRVLGDYDWSFKEWNGVVEPVKQMWVQSR